MHKLLRLGRTNFYLAWGSIMMVIQLQNNGIPSETPMSKFIRLFLSSFALAAGMLSLTTPLLSQTSIPVKQETILTYTHDFLQTFYPGLFDKNYRVSLCVTAPGNDPWIELGGVYFTVTRANVNPLRKLISSQPQPTDHAVLAGNIWLPLREYGRVQEVHANSDAVHEQQLEDLRRLTGANPEWSGTQIASALRQAGARFGPNDQEAFVSSLPLIKAERFLGKLKITSVEFQFPRRTESGSIPASALKWVVRADAELPDGTHPQYVFTFEPFEGKLTDLSQSLHR
jgi:hypothetical protein